jgi:translation initiation factor IF-3|tara:strand:+ start:470 stop:1015 length:546 start_codon:yes stop_codon:yes gene_type:complete
MAKRRRQSNKPNRIEYLVNTRIPFNTLRVVEENGKQLGVISKNEALKLARSASLDLVIIASKASPPVAKIIDFAKFKYEISKERKEKAKRDRSNRIEIKEVQFRPGIHDHDIEVKVRRIEKFLNKGSKVKVIIKFFGREQTHKDQAQPVVDQIFELLSDIDVKFDRPLDYKGQHVWCILTI